ncbi:MAG: hypothetical protein LLG01_01940 [Planctomycetaceae bacterium]|nr:hypothetical protein [Planctomycetaceae bacterium]
MSSSEPMAMLLNLIPRVLNWLVYAAIIVGVIIGMRRRPHWSCVLMLCGMSLVLLMSLVSAAAFQWYMLQKHAVVRMYGFVSPAITLLSVLGHAAFAAGFIVRMAISRKQGASAFPPLPLPAVSAGN